MAYVESKCSEYLYYDALNTGTKGALVHFLPTVFKLLNVR